MTQWQKVGSLSYRLMGLIKRFLSLFSVRLLLFQGKCSIFGARDLAPGSTQSFFYFKNTRDSKWRILFAYTSNGLFHFSFKAHFLKIRLSYKSIVIYCSHNIHICPAVVLLVEKGGWVGVRAWRSHEVRAPHLTPVPAWGPGGASPRGVGYVNHV